MADRGNSFKSIRDTVAHILGAEIVWYSRWHGQSVKLPSADQYPTVESLRTAWMAHEQKVRSFVDALGADEVNRMFEYTLFNGTPGATPFAHMLQHVVNHATYHRGQVTTMLRQMGAAPPKSMDLIAFYRERREVKT